MEEYLIYTGLLLYIVNYFIGWGLIFGWFRISVRTHQVVYTLLIINVIFALLFSDKLFSPGFSFGALSLLMLIILPFGKKGETYHKFVSSIGFLSYLLFLFS